MSIEGKLDPKPYTAATKWDSRCLFPKFNISLPKPKTPDIFHKLSAIFPKPFVVSNYHLVIIRLISK